MELMRTARLGLTTNVEMAEMREMHRSGDGNHCSTWNKLRHIMLRHIIAPTHGEQDRAEPRDEGAMHASELAEEERQERLVKRPMKRPMTASELAEEERPMKEERIRAPRVRFDPRCGPPPLARITPTETEAPGAYLRSESQAPCDRDRVRRQEMLEKSTPGMWTAALRALLTKYAPAVLCLRQTYLTFKRVLF